MKFPIRKPISVVATTDDDLTTPGFESVEYPHDSQILAEEAAYALNKRLVLEKRKDYRVMGTQYILQFRPSNPYKASLYQSSMLSDLDVVSARNAEEIERHLLRNMVDGVLSKAFEAIDTVHHLENSFWNRLKYLFSKTF